jgi:RIO kinase 1
MTTTDLIDQEAIASFFDEGYITEVIAEVKSGKEATVYCCKTAPHHAVPYFALKLYKSRTHRTFKNDSVYQEGRFGTGSRLGRAMTKGSAKGRKTKFNFWIVNEFTTLTTLFAAGAAVPEPIASGENGLLMAFVGTDDDAAEPLYRAHVARDALPALFDQAIATIKLMLSCHVVHADLSPYNILLHAGRLVVIDFPQAVDPRQNSQAEMLLRRDVDNVCSFFKRKGYVCDADAVATDIWHRYQRIKQ